MTLDEELLRAARTAGTASAAAQNQADIAKAIYHHSVLRLHRAGGSMREIAEALKMSHQRVHQIVEQSRRTERCWFCARSGDEVDKLMAGPVALICDMCVTAAQVAEVGHCSFCSETKPVHEGAEAQICRSCLDFSAAVISGAASPR
ncbi:ClpX C4-type zinc finger protein [Lentzea sp. BCCO 10_0061]|uniref:ClpX C4-type zinc finger protein n=1 Tax=Lentzea sokolovensis TaxID=3095429 RepID=A0ABU4VC01_9PSEU|nr:ClpX C4-type zinc finger protein [Lentzea sp. BCCO 10_0061]MDX8149348.1 ClpX C4-type zinc finger protein [Lentzea sp. BCCO 10_0061]